MLVLALRVGIKQEIFIGIDDNLALVVEVDLDYFIVEAE